MITGPLVWILLKNHSPTRKHGRHGMKGATRLTKLLCIVVVGRINRGLRLPCD